MTPFTRYDVVVLGGGPAGATTAAYLAKAGINVLVLERERFPRPHVGESLVTSTTRVFQELGFLEVMEKSGFPRKYGAAWTADNTFIYDHTWEGYDYRGAGIDLDGQVDVRFAERKQEGVSQDYTYHVDRGKFDELLLEHAEKLGADVIQEAAVYDVDFSEQPLVTIRYKRPEGAEAVSARMVVDATGRRALLGNKLRLRVADPDFDQYALHTWFEDYDRGTSSQRDFIFIHFLPMRNTWMWQIPISESITSIGVVTQKANFVEANGSHDEFFWDCLSKRPDLHENLKRARQVRPLKAEGDYSYAMKQFCGDRFVLVGDAARFVDPIFSSGVSIAMHSGRLCSNFITKAAAADDFSQESFAEFETTMRRGCGNWYKFISLYYRLNVLFTYFVRHPDYRLDVLRLLQGDVYDEEEPAVLAEMRRIIQEVEEKETHVWHKLLGTLRSTALEPRPA